MTRREAPLRSAVQVLIGVAAGVGLTLGVLGLLRRTAQPTPAVTQSATVGDLTGEVFIVTGTRANVKLGLVEVRAIRLSDARAFVAQRNREVVDEAKKLGEQLQRERRNLAVASDKLEAAKAADELEWKQSLRYPPSSPAHLPYDAGKHHAALARARNERDRWASSDAATSAALARLTTSEVMCASLPGGFVSSRTDSEGRFSLAVPRREAFVVAATASRNVVGRTENYCWFLTMSLGGAGAKRILLSNDNLTDARSPESFLQTGPPGS